MNMQDILEEIIVIVGGGIAGTSCAKELIDLKNKCTELHKKIVLISATRAVKEVI
jgi:glycine/D-amino acid oxidase-like deaminating enzyme